MAGKQDSRPGACFSKVPVTFRARKAVLGLLCLHSRSKFNNFENNTMKLYVNEAKLTGLWARKCASIQQVLVLKFVFEPEHEVSESVEKRAPGRHSTTGLNENVVVAETSYQIMPCCHFAIVRGMNLLQ